VTHKAHRLRCGRTFVVDGVGLVGRGEDDDLFLQAGAGGGAPLFPRSASGGTSLQMIDVDHRIHKASKFCH
jgi:hypothetical protein